MLNKRVPTVANARISGGSPSDCFESRRQAVGQREGALPKLLLRLPGGGFGISPQRRRWVSRGLRSKVDNKEIQGAETARWPRWKDHTRDERQRLGISWETAPWTQCPEVKLQGIAQGNERVKHLLDIAWVYRIKAATANGETQLNMNDLKRGFFADVSDSVHRHPWGAMSSLNQGSALQSSAQPAK